MVRRKRTLGVATSSGEEMSSSSPRHALSPKSIGTLDSSVGEHSTHTTNAGSTVGPNSSFVGSLIGHDDPTLLHANIQECMSSGVNDSATLASFLTTEAGSDDIRDSGHTSRSGGFHSDPRAMSDTEYLERELNKLDQTQEEWKAKHDEEQAHSVSGREMDATGDFYLDEVGGIHQSSPRRSKSLFLQDQTIVEEDESFDSSSYQSSANQSSSPEKSMSESPSRGNFVMAVPANVIANSSASAASSVVESMPSDLVFEYPSTEESDGRCTPTQHASNVLNVSPPDKASMHEDMDVEKDEVILQVQKRLTDNIAYNDTLHGTELQYQGDSFAEERTEPPSDQRRKGFRRWIPVGDDSERSRSWFKPRTRSLAAKSDADGVGAFEDDADIVDNNARKRRKKLCCINICLCLLIIAVIVCSVLFALEFFKRNDSADTEKSSNVVPPPTGSPVEKPTFNLPSAPSMPSFGSPTQSPTNASPVITIETEEGRVDGEASPGISDGIDKSDETPEYETDSSLTAPSQPNDVLTPTSTPSEKANDNVAGTSPPPISSLPRKAEERLVAISGDAIYDPETPQYAAYDWLQNEDPANLDLDNLSEQDLSQRYVAALFYFSLGGETWVEQYGFLGASDVCEWNNGSPRTKMGIVCDSPGTVEGSRVSKSSPITGIILNHNNLVGSLPSELESLRSLEMIQLRANSIEGQLPPQLGNCTMLQEIDLRENELLGTVPESIFNLPAIRNILLLRNYKLGGTIPSTIEKASNLEMLSFQKCKMTGTLPTQLGMLSNLFFITFMDNFLSGSIPPRVTQLPNLEVLELSGNQLQGRIPKFGLQPELYFVSLFDNQLTGSIPVSMASLPGLLFLDIRDNLLTGTIPRIIGRLPELVTFFAQNNQLSGNVPSFSGNDGMLQTINLSNNQLAGNLNAFFGANGPTNRLFNVDLSSNKITGSLPPTMGQFDALKELLLEDNALTGPIPVEMGNLKEMDTLVLRQNSLSSTLPEEIGMAESLMHLDVSFNDLTGTIPDTLIMLPELETLDLESNQFDGSVPSTFSLLSNLSELYLHNNNIRGDLSNTFCSTSQQPLGTFVSDCLGPEAEVTCSCCSTCCNESGCLQNN